MNPISNGPIFSKCSVCSQPSQYSYYGAKCCEACKHFFRRSISLTKKYHCKKDGNCDVEKDYKKCKKCRLIKCLAVGMKPQAVCCFTVQRTKQQEAAVPSSETSVSPAAEFNKAMSALVPASTTPSQLANPNSALEQKELLGFVMAKHLVEVEQKVHRIRHSQTPIPDQFFKQCDSFEHIFARKTNLLELACKFSTQPPNAPSDTFFEKVRQFGPFYATPKSTAKDLLFVFEIGKTFPFFTQLDISDQIALCSDIAMPLFMLCNGFYSVQQNSDAMLTPSGVVHIKTFEKSYFSQDPVAMGLGGKVLCKAVEPFSRLKLNTEEFVLLRAIIYCHMVSPGLSDHAQKVLFTEAEKYSSLLLRLLQTNCGNAPGALRYAELMGLIEFVFNTGAKHRELLAYISNVLDSNFDQVMPNVLAKISTIGPVESHHLLPY